MLLSQFRLVSHCFFFLLRIVIENNRAILCSNIVSLSVQLCRIMYKPKHLQQFIKGNHRLIINNSCHFRMTCCAFAHLFVRRIIDMSSCITGSHGDYSFQIVVTRFNAPKTSGTQCGFFDHFFLFIKNT
ncbi:hypothetical protein D3C71_768230 [compost metagenome]